MPHTRRLDGLQKISTVRSFIAVQIIWWRPQDGIETYWLGRQTISLPSFKSNRVLTPFAIRSWICFSSPTNAPLNMKRILLVSTAYVSPLPPTPCPFPKAPPGGVPRRFWPALAPDLSVTLTTVPSSIRSKACWTPSPETSLEVDGISVCRAILSISSINTIPVSALLTS